MSNAAKTLNTTRPLSAEERAKVQDRIYYNDPSVLSRAARFARERAYMERHGRLPPVFETVQTKQCAKPPTLREKLISEGKIKAK